MLNPQDVALAYDRHVVAFCREDTDAAMAFAIWLAPFWVDDRPPQPADYPDAVSFLGGAGHGVRWYRIDGEIIGYASGWERGCYRVPVAAVLPAVRQIVSTSRISLDRTRWSPVESLDGDVA